jgi:8-oxo-dGTP pyrophosphatase MutT (NUDIX family)
MGPFGQQIVGHDLSTLRWAAKRIRGAQRLVQRMRQGERVDEIRQLSSREVYRSPWMSVREDEVVFPSGAQGTYSVLDKQDFVLVLPYADGGFWLVEQFRYPVGRREWEFPQGGWPAGETGSPDELAARELREETGLRAQSLVHLGHLYAAYGYSSQGYDTYLATGLSPGPTAREVTESDMVHQWRGEAEVRAMIRRGEFADAHSLAALTLFELHRG